MKAAADRPRRLAIVASHPVQYQIPWYRALTKLLDVHVLYAHRVTAAEQASAGFDVEFEWDIPLFEGYSFEWLDNRASRPGVDHFWGCNTPGVAAAIERGRFDAVLVNGWQLLSYWQAIRAAHRVGLPVMVRGDSQLATTRGPLRRLVKRLAYPRMLRSFDACLAVGKRSADYYRHYRVPDARIYPAPHCVDNDFFAKTAAEARGRRADLRRELGLPDDAVVFMFAGKLIEKKRPLDFLEALGRIAPAHSKVWGLIVGDGPLKPALEEYSRRLDLPCVLVGFQNQRRIAETYTAADVLVLPSSGGETWGLVVNEAMAAGLPAIVSDQVGCVPDLIADGETGFAYPCGDIEALSRQMTRLAGHPQLRTSMRRHVAARIAAYAPGAAAGGVVRALEDLQSQYGTEPIGRTPCHQC
jgi:glycosyltransferase involved in cell wall biosynthesis